MKIVTSLEEIYEQQLPLIHTLKQRVDGLIGNLKKNSWHYYDRVKSKESFALKIETGRFSDLFNLEDFFACTIVVENTTSIKDAIELVKNEFEIIDQRPKSTYFTHKVADAFPFDDLRLYVRLKKLESQPIGPINDVVFELQIKTFLQHAWAIATHDLIYKSDSISWAKERVAYQIKAMLEQAEATISAIPTLANIPELAKNNTKIKNINKVKKEIIDLWDNESLPNDRIRLAKNIVDLITHLNITVSQLKAMIIKENQEGRGIYTKNLSPYYSTNCY